MVSGDIVLQMGQAGPSQSLDSLVGICSLFLQRIDSPVVPVKLSIAFFDVLGDRITQSVELSLNGSVPLRVPVLLSFLVITEHFCNLVTEDEVLEQMENVED